MKVFDPIASTSKSAGEGGGFVAFGNSAERANDVVLGRRGRGAARRFLQPARRGGLREPDVSPKAGDYARAQSSGVRCVPLLVEMFGGLSPPLVDALRTAAEWRKNKLTASEYGETTWSARTWMAFVTQRLSVASQLSMAQEAAEALGLSVAADPRAQ